MPSTRTTLFLGALSAIAAAQKTDAPCADVVIFMARGNDAPYQPDGRTFTFVETTCAKVAPASCDYMDAVFDATLGGDYCAQLAEGARNGVRQITEFNQRCPNTQIVINGYSQGAHVMGDVLGGPGGCTGSSTGIDSNSAAGKAIAAALLWGDVKHTANQPYNTLDGAGRGPQPRTGNDLALLNRYSSVLRAYCAAGDPVCAGGNDVAQHLNYFELYTQQAADWVVSMLKKKAPLTSSSASAPPTSALPSSATQITRYGNSTVPTTMLTSCKPTSTGGAIPSYGGDDDYVPYPVSATNNAVPSYGGDDGYIPNPVPTSKGDAVPSHGGDDGYVPIPVPTTTDGAVPTYGDDKPLSIGGAVPSYGGEKPSTTDGAVPSYGGEKPSTTDGAVPSYGGDEPKPSATGEPINACPVVYEYVTVY